MDAHTRGVCYLLHFERPYRHARHYLGWTNNLPDRLDAHLAVTGGRLLEVITAEGIGFTCVRVWHNTTLADERRLKNYHNKKLCPVCNPLVAKGVSRCQT